MSITRFNKDMNIIAELDSRPNAVGGLSAAELKAKFDEGGVALKEYINGTMLPEVEQTIHDVEHEISETYVKKVNGKTPDSAGNAVVNSNDILMGTGRYEDFSDEPITDVVDQLGERIDAAQSTANAAKTSADAAVKKVNGNAPDSSGAVLLSAEEIQTQQEEWQYNGSVTGAIDEAYEHAEEAMTTANAAKSTAETAQSVAFAAESAANAAVKRVNLKAPTLGSVVINSDDIIMQTGAYEDYYGETITHTIDDLGERIDSRGGKVELVRSGNQILRKGAALTFGEIRELLTVKPDFVYLLDGDWAYLTTYIYGEPTDAYQYIRFASTVIGDLRTKTSSIMIQTTNGGMSYTVTSSTINNENVSNKSDMSVLNDTRYPTTKSVADYVAAQLAAIPFAEGVTFGG